MRTRRWAGVGGTLLLLASSPVVVRGQCAPPPADSAGSYLPGAGFVPDSITAIRIAEAVMAPIYAASVLDAQRPFQAKLSGEVWTVSGTLPQAVQPGHETVGGVAVIRICRRDGRILFLIHGK